MKLTELQALAGKASDLFDHCVIGGGAVRDAFLGGPLKDIDLFVDTRGLTVGQFDMMVKTLANVLSGKEIVHYDGSVAGHFATYHITWNGPVIEVLPVERCVFTDIHDYDFGLSQVQMTRAGMLRTAAFGQDLANNTITYMKREANDKSLDRLRRIEAKYPDRMRRNCTVLTTRYAVRGEQLL